MKTFFANLGIVSLFAAGLATADHHKEKEAPAKIEKDQDGWVSLFNGKTTENWRNPYEWGKVAVVDGEIHLIGNKKFFLVTKKSYSDFVFECDIFLPKGKANSGVMFRCHVAKNKVFGYQAECDGSERCWSGGLYDEGRRKWIWPSIKGRSEEKFLAHEEKSQAFFATPEIKGALDRHGWNKYRIECKGDRIKIWVNDVAITNIQDDVDSKGHIGIQHHGEKGQTYKFRNLRIKELK